MHARLERQCVYDLRPELSKALLGLTMAVSSTLDDRRVSIG